MSGGGAGSQPLRQRLEKIIKNYDIGKGKKSRKSNFKHKSSQKIRKKPKVLNPSFTTIVKLKKDPKTGVPKDYGEITIPSQFRNVILPQHFPGVQPRDYYQIQMTNPRTRITGPVTCQVKSRGRIQFKQNLSNYFNYRSGDQIKFEFEKHFPQSQIGKISSVKTISSFKLTKETTMMRVYLPNDVQKLTGLADYQSPRYVQLEALGHQIAGKQYPDGSIGIKPASLGLPNKPQTFSAPVSIHNTHLTSNQKNQLYEQSRAQFVSKELTQLQDATGIPFTGDPAQDKPKMLEYIINDLTQQGKFDDFVNVEFNTSIPNTRYRPDGIGYRQGKIHPEVIELKAFATNTITNSQKLEKQLETYRSLGYRVNVITTGTKLPKNIDKIVDKIYTPKDISKWIQSSEKPLLQQLSDKIRENWP